MLTGGSDIAPHASDRLRAAGIAASSSTVERHAPADGVLAEADRIGAGAVIVGTRRPGRLRRALLGSTATAIAHRAPCPVVVVGAQLPT